MEGLFWGNSIILLFWVYISFIVEVKEKYKKVMLTYLNFFEKIMDFAYIMISQYSLFVFTVALIVGSSHVMEQFDYYGAAEPPVRRGVSHLSELTEPPLFIDVLL